MTNPYLIQGPAMLSFSGGRTSAFMLHETVMAHGGTLPDNVHVCFANTGKEREATLRFVHECATRWNVHVRWLEYRDHRKLTPVDQRFEEIGYNSASRAGEPFDLLLQRKVSGLPNGQQRWCTEFLKVLPLFWFAETVGLGKPGEFQETIGLRADEGHRIASMRADARNGASRIAFPLSTAGVRKSDILSFWSHQPFDLELPRGTGNCDHCPMIGAKDRVARAQRDPAGVEWWARHELRTGHRFAKRQSFLEVLGLAASSPQLPLDAEMDAECGTWCAGP